MTEQNSIKNQLLRALSESEYRRLAPHLEFVTLSRGHIVHGIEEELEFAYFPETLMISLVSIMDSGATTEICLIGNEGMIGLPIILGGGFDTSQAIVQIPGNAFKVPASILKHEFHQRKTLQAILLRYVQARLIHVGQAAACNRQHNIQERLARWLLSVDDCVEDDELPLTQEFIANMLGTRRSGVTVAANTLQQAGIIQYRRGKITILDREQLEDVSCECYCVVKRTFIRLLGSRRG